MKPLKGILSIIILGCFVFLIGRATIEKGRGELVRLKEPRSRGGIRKTIAQLRYLNYNGETREVRPMQRFMPSIPLNPREV